MRNLSKRLELLVATGKMKFNEYSQILQKAGLESVEKQIQELSTVLRKYKFISLEHEIMESGRRIILTGILPPPPSVSDRIENAGLRIVGNDIALFTRSYFYTPETVKDPGDYYVDFYRNHYPCPTLLYSSNRRIETILNMIKDKNVQGIIFIGEKFCEYEYLEIPYLEKSLKEEGIKCLFLEFAIDDNQNMGAFSTRIESFAELMTNTDNFSTAENANTERMGFYPHD